MYNTIELTMDFKYKQKITCGLQYFSSVSRNIRLQVTCPKMIGLSLP